MVNPEMLAIAFLLAVANNAIVDYLANPVRKRYPDFDLWFLPYVAFATGGVIAYIADVNLFAFIPGLVAVPGRLLTAAVIGGGSGLIHKVFDHADVEPLRESAWIPSAWDDSPVVMGETTSASSETITAGPIDGLVSSDTYVNDGSIQSSLTDAGRELIDEYGNVLIPAGAPTTDSSAVTVP